MSIVYTLASKLRKQPKLKRIIKNTYQITGELLSDKKTFPDSIELVSNPEYEHLFGYYDKSPWDISGENMIYLRVKDAKKRVVSDEPAEIIIKNMSTLEEKVIAKTRSWNVQQGCMLQWLGPDFKDRILYNDYRDGRYCSIILDINTFEESTISSPVYSVSEDGKKILTLDFSRLNTLRPGYGYSNDLDKTKDIYCPDSPCIWYINMEKNEVKPILNYKDLYNFEQKESMKNSLHKVNHIMLNPSGNRFMFLHRWINNGVKYDRLLTCEIDGTKLFNLLDEEMVSHCNWRDDETIIAFASTYEYGNKYYLLKDENIADRKVIRNLPGIDGHPSFSLDGRYIITDSYPNFRRKQYIYLYDIKREECKRIAEVYSGKGYVNENRCDLHPRWKRDSSEVCFDGAQDKYRQVYAISINNK